MNLILKIVQGPNAGAEIALIEGVNVRLGKGDDCDIVLADQTLPDVACEIEVGAERVMLLLPGGGQERLEPLHVKLFETTAIAVGPADSPWGTLVWPETDAEKDDEPQGEKPAVAPAPQPQQKSSRLVWILLIALVLFVVLEFVLWFFWPSINSGMAKVRKLFQGGCASSSGAKTEMVNGKAKSIDELAAEYKVEALPLESDEKGMLLKGNLAKSTDRLRLIAEAYSIMPGVTIELSDDETLMRSSTELLDMLTEGKLKVASAKDRELVLSGRVKDTATMRHVLEALNNDVKYIEKVDCSQVEIIPQVADAQVRAIVVAKRGDDAAEKEAGPVEPPAKEDENKDAAVKGESEPPVTQSSIALARLPIVGVVTTPYPYLVLRNGSRVVEGAEFNGYVISKIGADVILLRKGDDTLEWRP